MMSVTMLRALFGLGKCTYVDIRGVMIPTPGSDSESDFNNFPEIVDSNSNSSKDQFFTVLELISGTIIDSKIGYL